MIYNIFTIIMFFLTLNTTIDLVSSLTSPYKHRRDANPAFYATILFALIYLK